MKLNFSKKINNNIKKSHNDAFSFSHYNLGDCSFHHGNLFHMAPINKSLKKRGLILHHIFFIFLLFFKYFFIFFFFFYFFYFFNYFLFFFTFICFIFLIIFNFYSFFFLILVSFTIFWIGKNAKVLSLDKFNNDEDKQSWERWAYKYKGFFHFFNFSIFINLKKLEKN